ncbi:hypothetical protein OE88DRAFT_1658378 [Heliocybe sulcata]|uniref:Uncharacterized protein n=1 Tax=Heliocybe sulcata TaxID=5364 RepID=A0A5C3N200_9AGAM|nr:hypothetical protein OE88DRAFT_1658378 [Heliocybe sulcata]
MAGVELAQWSRIRSKILLAHLEDLARRTDDETLRRTLTATSCGNWAKAPPPQGYTDGPGEYTLKTFPGGLDEDDIQHYTAPSNLLDNTTHERLANDLHRTVTEIATFYWVEEELSSEELEQRRETLPDELSSHLDRICRGEEELAAKQEKIINLVEELHKIHPRLHERLADLLSDYSAPMHKKHLATHDLLASKIEASLLKLSLIRAKAHADLYGYRLPKNPEATMAKALSAAHERYTAEERKLEEEEEQLDKQLEEYRQMLELVDGKSREGGFGQVVEDWARVQKETEECKRDLRRLGWTGD